MNVDRLCEGGRGSRSSVILSGSGMVNGLRKSRGLSVLCTKWKCKLCVHGGSLGKLGPTKWTHDSARAKRERQWAGVPPRNVNEGGVN